MARRKLDSFDVQEPPPIGEELLIEPPAAGSGNLVSEACLEKLWIISVKQQMQDSVLVQAQVFLASRPDTRTQFPL